MTGKLQELLLREGDKLDLKKTLVICRAYEDSTKQSKEISCTAAGGIMTHKISKVGTKQRFPPKKQHYQATTSKPPQQTQKKNPAKVKHYDRQSNMSVLWTKS